MKSIEEMKETSKIINNFLKIISEDENTPLDFKIMNEKNKVDELYREVMINKKFINLSNENKAKKALYNFLKQEVEFLEDLKEEIK